MSRPLAHTPRPVKTLRAAPIAKCASMLTASDVQIAAPWSRTKNGAIGMKAPIAVAAAGDDAVLERRQFGRVNIQLLAHHRVERLRRILHHRLGGFTRALRRQALRLIDERELLFLEIRHEPHLVTLHLDLVRLDLRLALGRQVAARTHRQRVRDRARDTADDHDMRRDVGAEDTGHEAEVRGQAVIESVDEASQISAGSADMPRFTLAAHHLGELARVHRGIRRDVDRRLVGLPMARVTGHSEVGLHFAALFGQHHRENERMCRNASRPRRGASFVTRSCKPAAAGRSRANSCRQRSAWRSSTTASFSNNSSPLTIRFNRGKRPVQERGVAFVAVVLVPGFVCAWRIRVWSSPDEAGVCASIEASIAALLDAR